MLIPISLFHVAKFVWEPKKLFSVSNICEFVTVKSDTFKKSSRKNRAKYPFQASEYTV